jgi:hypothetical protein
MKSIGHKKHEKAQKEEWEMARMIRAGFLLGFCAFCVFCGYLGAQQRGGKDPAAWGSDHVGKPLPEFATGGECLFCHRNNIGQEWAKNRHNLTIHDVEPGALAPANRPKEATLILGGRRHQRFLKPNGAYGKLDLWAKSWDTTKFADRCAGCHATAVETKTRAFTSPSLDCFVCHGDVPADHANDTRLVYLSRKRQDPARVITSICAQCHVRTGKAKSTGLPYPNQFVAGDNLFRDFQVDVSPEALSRLNPADRHVLDNVRNVVILGKEDLTCLSCHDVHKQSTKKHHLVATGGSCLTCHNATGSKKVVKSYEVHSATCEY